MRVDVLDLGLGNVFSVANTLKRINVHPNRVQDPSQLKSDVLIIPGVGCAGTYMSELKKNRMDSVILDCAAKGKKIIGICLGFQILTKYSEEDGGVEGLGLLQATTKALGKTHNGWESFEYNKILFKKHTACQAPSLTLKRKLQGRVYFNHEYGVVSQDDDAATLSIGEGSLAGYVSMMVKDNIIGAQFHPEKSQVTGIELLRFLL